MSATATATTSVPDEKQQVRLRRVIIPIAGYGSRMFPASKVMPKALMPCIDREGFCTPVLHVIIEEALSALGDDAEICIVVQPGQQELIENYFHTPVIPQLQKTDLISPIERIKNIAKRISFVTQTKQDGFGHSILCAREFIGNDPYFLVMLGDHVYRSEIPNMTCMQQIVSIFHRYHTPITSLDTCTESVTSSNGLVIGKNIHDNVYQCIETVEKPTSEYARQHLKSEGVEDGQYLCYFGIDILPSSIFATLQNNYDQEKLTKGELQLRDAQRPLMLDSNVMYGVRIAGQRLDTGQPDLYARTLAILEQDVAKRKAEEQQKS